MLFKNFILSSVSLAALFDWTNAATVAVRNPPSGSLIARQSSGTYVWTDDIPYTNIPVTYNELTCPDGTSGSGCTGSYVEQAYEYATTFFVNELGVDLVSQYYAGDNILDYLGTATGHDDTYSIYATMYFQIYNVTQYISFIQAAEYNDINISNLVQNIINGFQDNNAIIQCAFFQNYPTNPWGSAVATVGWNGAPYLLSTSDQQSYISNCWDNGNHGEY